MLYVIYTFSVDLLKIKAAEINSSFTALGLQNSIAN